MGSNRSGLTRSLSLPCRPLFPADPGQMLHRQVEQCGAVRSHQRHVSVVMLCNGDIVFRWMDTPFEVRVKDGDTTPSGLAWREIHWGKTIHVLRLANDAVGSEAI